MSFEMFEKLPELCSDHIWYKKNGNPAFWHILFHVLSGVRYWMRLTPGELQQEFPGKKLYPDFEQEPEDVLSKAEIHRYMKTIKIACDHYFSTMTDALLLEISVLSDSFTHLDIILLLTRHIQYHVGQCNTLLKENNLKTVGWIE